MSERSRIHLATCRGCGNNEAECVCSVSLKPADTPSAPDRESGAKPDPRDILDRLRGMASAWNALPSGPMGWLCFPEHYREAAAEIVRLRTALAAAEKGREEAKARARIAGVAELLADNATLAAECEAFRRAHPEHEVHAGMCLSDSPGIMCGNLGCAVTKKVAATDSAGALLRASGRKEADRAE